MLAEDREFAFTDEDFRQLAALVSERTGIVLAEHKRQMVYSRLARRLRSLRLKCFADYRALLASPEGDDETVNFVNAITTNLTSFFREGHHFEHLRKEVFEPMLKRPASERRLRIWSAGCSGGQEPYTIAMVVRDVFRNAPAWDIKILATDIDTEMLARGQRGEYPLAEMEKIPVNYRSQNVTMGESPKGPVVRMKDELKEYIHFKRLNLLERWPMRGPFDVVFCRNVVIYFDKPTQSKLFNRVADLMPPASWLYIGHSENLFNVNDSFKLLGKTIYRKQS